MTLYVHKHFQVQKEPYMKNATVDLILLDLMLPGISGEKFLKELRSYCKVPVIIITAKDELDSKVDLLTLGADDYITKPFEMKELIARVGVWLRRSGNNEELQILTHKKLTLDKNTHRIFVEEEELYLTKQEFKILELLLTYPKKAFSKQEIYNYAWDDYFIGEDKTIHVHISNIRSKLKKLIKEEYIETVWGIGFKLAQ